MSSEDGCRLVVTHQLWHTLSSSQGASASNGKFSDDDVELEGEEEDSFAIPAHRKLLAGVSPRFRQLLEGQGRARVAVPGVASLALLDVVAFVYTGRIQFRAVTPLRICGNLQQRGLPLWMAKPLQQTVLSADLVKIRKILTVRKKI